MTDDIEEIKKALANPLCPKPFEPDKLRTEFWMVTMNPDRLQRIVEMCEDFERVIHGLRYNMEHGCFCEVSIGHPMQRDHHPSCIDAMETLAKYAKRGGE